MCCRLSPSVPLLSAWLLFFGELISIPLKLPAQQDIASSPSPTDVLVDQLRPPESEADLRGWLENMLLHRFTPDEIEAVVGLPAERVAQQLAEYGLSPETLPPRPPDRLLVLPYPGGRHPRIGFLEGAVGPQRDTKLSVFAPWDEESYAVLDIPEAIWSDLGLTYLAHTHVPTIWTRQQIELPRVEWNPYPGGYIMQRTLPNGIQFGTIAVVHPDHVALWMWLYNGTNRTLTDLRVQNCAMLKGMVGFTEQTNDNKLFREPYAVAFSEDRQRWIVSAWDPPHRTWGNARCPCLHSDPKFPDCPPGETRWLRGWFSFYSGSDIESELVRIEATGWRSAPLPQRPANLTGRVFDASTGRTIPCRLYVQRLSDAQFFLVRSGHPQGAAVTYDRQRFADSIERHTCLSAHTFEAQLPPGRYRIIAEHGKDYLPAETIVELDGEGVAVELALLRFSSLTERRWYSGDVHVHRTVDELPTVMRAEGLNVALPLTHWVRDSRETPAGSGPSFPPRAIEFAPNYAIYPVNTEYEIFSIDRRPHTQGAVFILNHQRALQASAPPVVPVAQEAERQAAILDLDKHSWNWSLMVIPVMQVDLFELSNNHHWKTRFGFTRWTAENAPPDWPEIETDANGFTELGWTEFGLQTYYALLNCGFRLRVSAGTASGVHPVPLGYGRVYVHVDGDFSYAKWIRGLDQGHSFVTQGPLMDLRFDQELPGHRWQRSLPLEPLLVAGTIESAMPLESIEIVVNGRIIQRIEPANAPLPRGGFRSPLNTHVDLDGSSWVAVRCFQAAPPYSPPGKIVFAHSNPVFIDVPDRPLVPRRRDVEWFVQRMEEELQRNRGILSQDALAEYRQALAVYQSLLERARTD